MQKDVAFTGLLPWSEEVYKNIPAAMFVYSMC